MSLNVQVFLIDPDGRVEIQDTPEDAEDSAGNEDWRTAVWGSPAARAVGARFFPQLAEGDLYVRPEEVEDFQRECVLLRANLRALAPEPRPEKRPWEKSRYGSLMRVSIRLAIIEVVAIRARDLGGGVLIW
jgi:hypothetical protein